MVEHFLLVKRKGRRKPRLSETTVATLKQNVVSSPVKQLIPRPSPTPISPSYKAKTSAKVNVSFKAGKLGFQVTPHMV